MTMLTKTLAAGAAALALAGLLTVTSASEADAQGWNRRGPRVGGPVFVAPGRAAPPRRRGARINGGAVAAGVIGALAVGAIAAQAAQPRAPVVEEGCYRVRRRVWSEYEGAYVMRRVTVCD